jgi:hypothetical protein
MRCWAVDSASYSHGDEKVGLSLVEFAYLRYDKRGDVGYECLYDKDDGYDSEVRELVGG